MATYSEILNYDVALCGAFEKAELGLGLHERDQIRREQLAEIMVSLAKGVEHDA